MAFAPSSRAFSTMRSMACRRLSSSSRVYCGTSPWRSEVSPAPNDFAMPMLRTTRPKASPRSCSMIVPGSPRPVVMGNVADGTPPGVDSDMTASYGRSMPMRLAVCAEMVFLDLPITERVQRIAEAGFDAEIWDWTRHDVGDMAERAGVTFCLENLNTAVDHPGVPFARAADTLALVEAVGHPRVRLMLDLYHAQIGEGNLIELVRRAGPLIGEIQVADVPGRCEPGTGEINYPAIAAALAGMGYDGTVGLEAWAADGDSQRALDRFRAAFTI